MSKLKDIDTSTLEKIASLLPLGYLYLIVLGGINQSIFYWFIGINIFNYVDISDVLISPVSTLTSSWIILAAVIVYVIMFFLGYNVLLLKYRHKAWIKYCLAKKDVLKLQEMDENKAQRFLFKQFVVASMIGMACLYLGMGIGKGFRISQKISQGDLVYERVINFKGSDKPEKVSLINSNSLYYFYIEEGNPNIKISPVIAIESVRLIQEDQSISEGSE